MKSQSKNDVNLDIIPLADRVLIQEHKEDERETKTKSGIIIPITKPEGKGVRRGIIVAVGPGRYENGAHVSVSVKKGDVVLFQWGEDIVLQGQEYCIVCENELIAVIK